MVVMKGVNDGEIEDFMDFAFSKGAVPRFIEFMNVTPLWRKEYHFPIEEVVRICERRFSMTRAQVQGSGPADYYRIADAGFLGFINTSEYNCGRCGRLRLTSTGELKICLYETQGLCLRSLLRQGSSDEEIKDTVRARMESKQYMRYQDRVTPHICMSHVGG